MNIPSEKARLLALADAATQGQWKVWTSGGRGSGGPPKQVADLFITAHLDKPAENPFATDRANICSMTALRYEQQSKDAAFIAAAHDLAALVRAMELRPDQRIVTVEFLQRMTIACAVAGSQKAIDEIHAIIGEKK